jgi:RNA-directed DNA polymerase
MHRPTYQKLARWAAFRHAKKGAKWRYRRYWRRDKGRIIFSDGRNRMVYHADTQIRRHIKVKGSKSPFDGDWVYWSTRMGRDPNKPLQVVKLLQKQKGKCVYCGLYFRSEDIMEVHHRDGNHTHQEYSNLALLHGHCHDSTHSEKGRL